MSVLEGGPDVLLARWHVDSVDVGEDLVRLLAGHIREDHDLVTRLNKEIQNSS